MESKIYIGVIFLIIGALMTIKNQSLGNAFYNIRKQIGAKNKKVPLFSFNEINSINNPKKASHAIKVLGIIIIVQGLFFILN